jgi:hypothetical protein
MIKYVRIQSYKSLADVSVRLEPVTVLIGRSGTGKSNFVEALRWLRDYLIARNEGALQQRYGPWERVLSATAPRPLTFAFQVTFDAPNIREDFDYSLTFVQKQAQRPLQFQEEKLVLGSNVLFHLQRGKWVQVPSLAHVPTPSPPMLGALTGIQEVTIAHLVLTRGIGCYAFPDDVLTRPGQSPKDGQAGLNDNGDNYLQTFVDINVNLETWHTLRGIAASLRSLKPSLKNLDLQMPLQGQVVVSHEVEGQVLVFDVTQESEGFRRLLACLLALYQTPPKQTLIFDEPEKGIYPPGLAILAEEFKGYASKGRGQVLLTTHSLQFLDHFAAEQIRVVEMRDYTTRIGPVASEQREALRERFLAPSELLTVEQARLEGSLAGAE